MELIDLTRIFFALIAVLGLIGLLALLARKAGLSGAGISFGADKRLSVVETMAIDARRKAVILRCDDREHLVLLSSSGETLIESNMPAMPASEQDASPEAAPSFGEAMKKLTDLGRGANPFAEKYAATKAAAETKDSNAA
ncbi:MAG: flagellar biosynthetic protein FliO [Pseudomonadota bacterium]